MRNPRFALAILASLCVTATAWSQPSDAARTTVRASNDFACDLFRQLDKDKPGENLFFSPWSISSALAMTMEGARTETAAEMGEVLRLPKDLRQAGDRPWNLNRYHTGFAEMQARCNPKRDLVKDGVLRTKVADLKKELDGLNKQIQQSPSPDKLFAAAEKLAATINQLQGQLDPFELNVANAIWGEKTYPHDPKFAEAVAAHYGSGLVRDADFINQFPAERAKINRWVEDRTKERIKDLIPKIPEDEARLIRMILINAIYFKSNWAEPFDKKATTDEPFYLSDGKKSKTPFMHRTLPVRYAAFNADGSYFDTPLVTGRRAKEKLYPDANGFLVAELPYNGNRLAMTVILPENPKGLAALEAKLTGEALDRWLARLQKRDVEVRLPRFRMNTDYTLADSLKKMGMKLAFQPQKADFQGMTTSRDPEHKLHISHVLHKAFVDVNEEGTEAAAATAVILKAGDSALAFEPFNPVFRADRPFLFLIREVDTGAILFLGRMTMPGK